MITLIDDVTALSDTDLLNYSVKLAQHETSIGLQIIACLRETERRMLYLQMGLSSLWTFATQYLGLSEGNAQLKISAMRLGRDNPVAQEKIESGELSLVNAAKVSTFFRQEKKAGNTYTPQQKAEVIQSVVGLSQSQCERQLLTLAPEGIPEEKVRPLTETRTEIKMVVDEETLAVLDRLRELLSHQMPDATYAELLAYLARDKVEALEKKLMGKDRPERNNKSCKAEITAVVAVPDSELSGPPTPRKYISVKDRRAVMRGAQGQCEYIAPNGRRCGSRWKLQLDHKIALALGGRNEKNNYRAVCARHNLYSAHVALGPMMKRYVLSLK